MSKRLLTCVAIVALCSSLLLACGGGGGGDDLGAGAATPTTFARYALVTDADDDSVSTYVVDSGSGRLRWIGKAATGARPLSVAVHPAGSFAYVANRNGGTVSQYALGTNGVLTPLSPGDVPAGTNPFAVTVHPAGTHAYVANP